MKAKVAFDLDNVVVDILESARRTAAAMAGVEHDVILDTWTYATPFSHEDPVVAALIVTDHVFWQKHEILLQATVMEGAVEAIRRLHDAEMLAGYITRRAPNARDLTLEWLRVNGLPDVALHHVGHEDEALNHAMCKADICLEIGATHLVDDSQHEVQRALDKGIIPILVDHPLGRAARMEWLSQRPHVMLARDAVHAVEMLLD